MGREEDYFTSINVNGSALKVPTELLRNKTGPVFAISVFYKNMTGLLPETLPERNGTILASSVLSTSLQCGEGICDTSTIRLSLPVIITLQHNKSIQVYNSLQGQNYIVMKAMVTGSD